MSDEVYPPSEGWFVQFQEPDSDEWITWSPTHDRSRAFERKKQIELDHPQFTVRVVKETTRYTLDEGE